MSDSTIAYLARELEVAAAGLLTTAAERLVELADKLDGADELIGNLRSDLADVEGENEYLSSRIEELERQE